MKRLLGFLLVTLLVVSCSRDFGESNGELGDLKEQVRRISDTTGSLAALISSDYSTCPASGDTADQLIRKICNVAQAATNEARLELKGELSIFVQMLQTQIDAINNDLVTLTSSISTISGQIATINATLTTLDGRVTSAEAAIVALQALTSSITGTLAGNMIIVDIGNENAAAGPIYESVLRRNDKQRFNGYVEALGPALTLGNNPVGTTNASSTVAVTVPNSVVTITVASPGEVTWTAHGLAIGAPVRFTTTGALPTGLVAGTVYYVQAVPTANTFNVSATVGGLAIDTTGVQSGVHTAANTDITMGDVVRLTGLTAGGGFTSGDLVKDAVITATATDFSTFSLVLPRNASSTTTFGGAAGVARRIVGRGMSTLWKALDASDTVVRVSNLGTKRYNFLIRRIASDVTNNTAELCYDRTNNLAVFATINAAAEGGSGNISCK